MQWRRRQAVEDGRQSHAPTQRRLLDEAGVVCLLCVPACLPACVLLWPSFVSVRVLLVICASRWCVFLVGEFMSVWLAQLPGVWRRLLLCVCT